MTPLSAGSVSKASAADDEERALWYSYVQAKSAAIREQLFRHYQILAKNMAARYRRSKVGGQVEYAELYQLACTGLLESIDRFKPELGVPFRYFANRRMSGSILNGIAKYSELNWQISTRRRVERDRVASLSKDAKRTNSIDEKLDLLSEIAAGLALGFIIEASDRDHGGPQSTNEEVFETLAWKQMIKLVRDEIQQLQPQQRDIMQWHYSDGLPFDQIAAILNLSKGRISQIHKAAIALLRKRLLNNRKIWFEG
jgi:RNA polymerase sigma factor FliA